MDIYVIGGTGGIGAELVEAYKRENIDVTAISSTGADKQDGSVRYVRCDMTDSVALGRLIKDKSLVFHCANVAYHKWTTELKPMMDGLLASTVGKQVHLVYLDNFYAYGDPDGPVLESNTYKPVSKKGEIRKSLAEIFEDFVYEHGHQGTIVRAGDVYGATMNNAVFGDRTFKDVAAGKNPAFPVPVEYDHYFNPVTDVARALKMVGETTDLESPVFEIFHVPSSGEVSIQTLVEYASKEEDTKLQAKAMPKVVRGFISIFVPPLKEFDEMQYEFSKPVSASSSNFESQFQFEPTSHEEAVSQELQKFKAKTSGVSETGEADEVKAQC